MTDTPLPSPGTPRPRTSHEYEDNHFHDEEEVAPPLDEARRLAGERPTVRPARKLPPPPRRFHED